MCAKNFFFNFTIAMEFINYTLYLFISIPIFPFYFILFLFAFIIVSKGSEEQDPLPNDDTNDETLQTLNNEYITINVPSKLNNNG